MSCDNSTRFPNKPRAQDVILEFGFGAELAQGEVLSAVSPPTVEVLAGEDPNPAAFLGGMASVDITGTIALVPVTLGLVGVSYSIQVVVSRSGGGPDLVLSGYITVTD